MKVKILIRQYMKMGVQNLMLPVLYRIFRVKPIQKGLIIFADAHHFHVPASMEQLVGEIKHRGNMKVVEFYDDYQQISFFRLLRRMVIFMSYYAKAQYVVICDNFLPAASCKKRKGTTVIQLWHGCGAFKKFGYDTTGDIPSYYKGNVFKNCDIVTVSAPACVPHFQTAMRLPAKAFRSFGVCRTDKYFEEKYNEDCRKLFDMKYPDAQGKKIVLWAPTFRGSPADPKLAQYEDIQWLARRLGDDVFIIIKVHPLLIKKYPYDNCTLTTDQLLPVADLMITDYSSIFFEYCIYKRPIIFYAPDVEKYGMQRGFYLDYNSLPGVIAKDKRILEQEVRHALLQGQQYDAKAEAFYKKYMCGCDGHVLKRMTDFICGSGE